MHIYQQLPICVFCLFKINKWLNLFLKIKFYRFTHFVSIDLLYCNFKAQVLHRRKISRLNKIVSLALIRCIFSLPKIYLASCPVTYLLQFVFVHNKSKANKVNKLSFSLTLKNLIRIRSSRERNKRKYNHKFCFINEIWMYYKRTC